MQYETARIYWYVNNNERGQQQTPGVHDAEIQGVHAHTDSGIDTGGWNTVRAVRVYPNSSSGARQSCCALHGTTTVCRSKE
jgi:hypothetical protein